MEEELKKYLPKELTPLLFSYLLDELNLDDLSEQKFAILALKEISPTEDGLESKNFPSMKDVKIFKDSYILYPDDRVKLIHYLEENSDYLLKKFYNKKYEEDLCFWMEKYSDEKMLNTFFELGYSYPLILLLAITYTNNKIHNYEFQKELENKAIKNLHLLDEKTSEIFANIFYFFDDEKYFVEVLEAYSFPQETITYYARGFIKNHLFDNWILSQKTLYNLIEDEKLRAEFARRFNL